MAKIQIDAQSRARSSTSDVRRMRHEGLVPGIVYGGEEDNVNIKLDHNKILHNLDNETFHSSILLINIDGELHQLGAPVIADVAGAGNLAEATFYLGRQLEPLIG